MIEYESKGISPAAAFWVLIAFMGAGLLIGTLAGAGIWVAMTGNSILNIEKDMMNPRFANAARIFQVISVFFAFYVPAIATARMMSRQPFRLLGYREGFNVKQIFLALFILLACMPIVGALSELNQAIPLPHSATTYFHKLEDNYTNEAEALAIIRSPMDFVFSLIVMAFLPALFEETLFRGGLQQILVKWFKKPMAAIVVASIIFSAMHISYYGFLGRFALGMVLGLIYYYSGSIWLSMTAHFANNAFAVTVMYYYSTHGKPAKEALDDKAGPIWWVVPSVIVLLLLLRAFRDVSFKRKIHKIPPMDGPSIESNIA